MRKLFTKDPQRTYWLKLSGCLQKRGLRWVATGPNPDDDKAGVEYFGMYDTRLGLIAYFYGLTEEERAMALTHELIHATIRPPSPDAEPYIPNSVPSEERVVHHASSLICNHFGLGDYFTVWRSRSVPYLDGHSPDELAEAIDRVERLIPELEQSSWTVGWSPLG